MNAHSARFPQEQEAQADGRMCVEERRQGKGEQFIRALPTDVDECIVWPFSCNVVSGYGQTVIQGNKTTPHRAAATLFIGPAPSKRHEVAHSCGVRACCNPRHLRWATRSENHADKLAHGTHMRGAKSPNAKLTERQVRLARRVAGRFTHEVLAERFGVSRATVSLAIEGKTWTHLTDELWRLSR